MKLLYYISYFHLMLLSKARSEKIVVFILLFFHLNTSAQSYNLSQPEINHLASPNIKQEVDSLFNIADSLKYVSSSKSIALLDDAIYLATNNNYNEGAAKAIIKSAQIHKSTGNLDSALALLKMAYSYCQQNERLKAEWHINLASPYTHYGLNDYAIKYIFKGLNIANEIKDTNLIIQAYVNLGAAFINSQKNQYAIDYLLKAERCIMVSEDSTYLSLVYSNLAAAHLNLGNPTQVYYYANKTLVTSNTANTTHTKINALRMLGRYYLNTKNFKKALEYLFEALNNTESNNLYKTYQSLNIIAEAYYYADDLHNALKYANEALSYAERTSFKEHSMGNLYELLSAIHFKIGNDKKALFYYRKYSKLALALANTIRDKVIEELEVENKLQEKDNELLFKQIELLEQKTRIDKRNNLLILFSVIGISFIFFSILFIRTSKRKINSIKQNAQINKLKATISGEEKERERIARELHDGIGGLITAASISIRNLGYKKEKLKEDSDYNSTINLLEEIGTEVRKTAHNLMPEVLFHHNLADAIKIFCTSIKSGKKIEIEVISSGELTSIPQDLLLSSYRVLQELIHNILKHSNAKEVLVQINRSHDLLGITVEDNGNGFEEEKVNSGAGIQNIRSRVNSHNGKISIESTPSTGTSVYIEFDLQKNNILDETE